MNRKFVVAVCAAVLACAAVPVSGALGAGSNGTSVTVRVEGLKKTLLAPKLVKAPTAGSITKGGAPAGACPAASGAGALDVATKHKWNGKYSQSVKDIFITKILGDSESGTKFFWSIYVNNVASSTGACGIKLHKGDQLLFAVVPATGTTFPLGLKAPASVKVLHKLKVTVLAYDAKGKTKPLAGATVEAGKLTGTTNKHGVVRLKPTKTGKVVIVARDKGYVRAAPLTVTVTP